MPKSKELHREYVKFELLFVEKLMARKKILALEEKEETEKQESTAVDEDQTDSDDAADNSDDEQDDKEKKSEEKKKKRKSIKELDQEISDSILQCDLVNLVVEVRRHNELKANPFSTKLSTNV